MYKLLTDNQVKNLVRDYSPEEGWRIVTHIHDGEYECHVFGNLYTSFWRALVKCRQALPDAELGIYKGEEHGDYFICYIMGEEYSSYLTMRKIARLTLEFPNQKFDLGY